MQWATHKSSHTRLQVSQNQVQNRQKWCPIHANIA